MAISWDEVGIAVAQASTSSDAIEAELMAPEVSLYKIVVADSQDMKYWDGKNQSKRGCVP
jgi:hypothetical protein